MVLPSMSLVSATAPALATLPTNSNGTSETDDESNRQSLRKKNLPSSSLVLPPDITSMMSRPNLFFSSIRSLALHLPPPTPSSFPTSLPKPNTLHDYDARLSCSLIVVFILSRSPPTRAKSNISLAQVMGALCVVIFQLPEVLRVDCEFAYPAS